MKATSRTHRLTLFAVTTFILALPGAVRADVVGRLRFSVKNAADEKPLAKAKITLKDSAGVKGDVTLTTDDKGGATTGDLDARPWRVTTEADTFTPDTRDVSVVADTTTDVELLLEPLKEKVIKITGAKQTVTKSQTNEATKRDQTFIHTFPTSGNPQNLRDLLKTAPGFAVDSVNQAHPRGEHSATGININGFYLPGALSGRAGPLVVPSSLQNADILTGGFSPEYGGETAAVLNLTLRSGPIVPFRDLMLQGGQFQTLYGDLTFGGQAGAPYGQPDAAGHQARRFGYLIDITGRRTDNALDPPQPDNQTAHNRGTSESFFGNFDFRPGKRDQLQLVLNDAPAYTQVANRTGLPAEFASVGQGFGYGGHLSAAQAAAMGILSQQAAGQDINARDSNYFGLLSWRHEYSNRLHGYFSFGGVHSGQEILNNNPFVNLDSLPGDSSIEFNPTLRRSYRHFQPQGSLTYNQGKHTLKAGFLYDDQQGDESYQFIPDSQLALDALAATDTRLAPSGHVKLDAGGKPVMDALGNPVFVRDAGARVPTLHVSRSGYYAAAYAQDTWNITKKLTANYGVRLDGYKQSQNLGDPTVKEGQISPRVNLAYAVTPKTIARASYNRLFIQPPLSDGAILGESIRPERLDQYDLSLERQVAPRQTVKVAVYNKQIRNQIDTGLLIPGTQIGAFASVNLQRDVVNGLEISYDLLPKNNVGWGAYLTYALSRAQPGGTNNLGEPVEAFNDHDQRHTLNVGMAYALKNGASAALNLYYGSGVASSVVFSDTDRHPHSQLNLSLSTGPRLFGKDRGGLRLDIENLADDRSVINFASDFSGTRFQQGRRVLASAFLHF